MDRLRLQVRQCSDSIKWLESLGKQYMAPLCFIDFRSCFTHRVCRSYKKVDVDNDVRTAALQVITKHP